jgi:hypothetical protein
MLSILAFNGEPARASVEINGDFADPVERYEINDTGHTDSPILRRDGSTRTHGGIGTPHAASSLRRS